MNVKEVPIALVSCKVCIDYDFNILYDGAFNGACCISNQQQDYFPWYDTSKPEELLPLIETTIQNDNLRYKCIKDAKKMVVERDTYFHRLHDIFIAINEKELAETSMNLLGELT